MAAKTRAYRVRDLSVDEEPTTYVGTFAQAREFVREKAPIDRDSVVVAEVEVASDKDGLLQALNGEPVEFVKRQWIGTKRGGLRQTHDEQGRL